MYLFWHLYNFSACPKEESVHNFHQVQFFWHSEALPSPHSSHPQIGHIPHCIIGINVALVGANNVWNQHITHN